MLKIISLLLIICIIVLLIFYKKEYIFSKLKTKKNFSNPTFNKANKTKLKEFKYYLNNSDLDNNNFG